MNDCNRKTQRTNLSPLSISFFFFGMPHCGLCSYIKGEKRVKCPWFSAPHATRGSPRVWMLHVPQPRLTHVHHVHSTDKTWSLAEAASSHARPAPGLLETLRFIPDMHYPSPCSWLHSKSRHLLTLTAYLGRPCLSFSPKASLLPHAQTPFPFNLGQ